MRMPGNEVDAKAAPRLGLPVGVSRLDVVRLVPGHELVAADAAHDRVRRMRTRPVLDPVAPATYPIIRWCDARFGRLAFDWSLWRQLRFDRPAARLIVA